MDKKTQVFILAFLLLIGLGYGYYEFVFSGQLEQIKRAEAMVIKNQSDIIELRQIQQNKESSLNKIDSLNKELVEINKALPDTSDLANFNIELYYLIKQQDVNITSVEPGNINDEKEYGCKSQDIDISMEGNTKDIAEFINYLKQYPRKVKIKAADIKVLNVEQVQMDMTIQVFFLK